MTVISLKRAIEEAKRFIRAAEEVEITLVTPDDETTRTYSYVVTGKESAACKRASMDLTRALAEMRKP